MISISVDDKVATLTIDRQAVHNALDSATLSELESTLRDLAARDDVGVLVLTGAGDRAFVAGGDLTELAQPAGVKESLGFSMQDVFDRVARFPKATIAAVNGMALGGGLELALACDIRVASANASFALPELAWSLLPAGGGVTRLTRLIGPGRALELMLTGRRMGASEAHDVGLVSQVVAAEQLLETARELARVIATKAPLAVRVARLTTRVAAEGSLEASLLAETLGSAALHGTADRDEGRRAFLEKRPARFEGR